MKKLLFLFLIICNICKANNNYTLKDTTIIHQISFSRNGNPADGFRELLENPRYIFIIEENGDVLLKWNGRCPPSKNNSILCSYTGTITKKQLNTITKKLQQIKYTELKDLYAPLKEYEHTTSDSYIITYNNGIKKKIEDQMYDVDGLKEFREMLIKLKKEIKWIPVEGSYGVPRS
jgi:hypothetical protein